MNRIWMGLLIVYWLLGCSADGSSPIPPECCQLLVMVTPAPAAIQGRLQRFERSGLNAGWRAVGQSIPVTIGRNGLGWGRGLHTQSTGDLPAKRDGDGRSPAGLFRVTALFGTLPPDSLPGLHMPYRRLTIASECVDDVASRHYNCIVERNKVPAVDWQSSEKMMEIMPYYRLGAVIAHNMPEVVPGAGCCIFLHIRTDAREGSAGCTTMPALDMRDVALWLDSGQSPVIVQLTATLYAALRDDWKLPDITNELTP